MAKVGVFDSGVGGLSVTAVIQQALPDHEILYVEDKENVPYGTKTPDVLYQLVKPILNTLVDEGCEAIVIACNTVTTTLITKLREELPVPLIGIEPMVKPASELTESGIIAVCATPTTLTSSRYRILKESYAGQIKVLEPDCSDWALLIENNEMNSKNIEETIGQTLDDGADVIVLACTHYHWIEKEIKQLAQGRATVLQPEPAIIKRLKQVLEQTD